MYFKELRCDTEILVQYIMYNVDPGERIGEKNRSPKEKQCQIVPQRNAISLRFCTISCTKTLSV